MQAYRPNFVQMISLMQLYGTSSLTNSNKRFIPCKPFKDNMVFSGKAEEPTQVKHLSGAPLQGRLLTLPTNKILC
jgi:hypothetical protein